MTATKLPRAVRTRSRSLALNQAGQWGVISDIHIPFHDVKILELFAQECKRRKVAGLLLNGDVMDFYKLSRYLQDPSYPAFSREVRLGRQFFKWMREQFRRAEIIYNEGNHDKRFRNYIYTQAANFSGVDNFELESVLRLDDTGVQFVSDQVLIDLGKLSIVHGHEFPSASNSPVNPARGLYTKAKRSAICGHHHRTSSHSEKDVKGKIVKTWSLGCASDLSPEYMRYNNWNHGFAFVEVASDRSYHVDNLSVIDGRLC